MRITALIIASIFLSGFIFANSFGSNHENSVIQTTIEITSVGLELTKSSILSGDAESAKKFSKFTSDYFGRQTQIMRTTGSPAVDEVHILLLDIHTKINSGDASEAISLIENTESLLRQIPVSDPKIESVIVSMLIIADEHYQNGIVNGDSVSYEISKMLVERSHLLFKTQTTLGDRLTLEVESFFADLKSQIEAKEDFIKVGNLITVIQKDLLGTESVVINQESLYQKIRDLYDELLIALDEGDYATAEEKAIEAYLDNFEYLEPDIEKVDADLLYTLELDMREELRDMIRAKKSPSEIQSFIEGTILPDLTKAESLVSEARASNPSLLEASAFSDDELKDMGDATEEEKSGVRQEIDFIRKTLQDMMIFYENGDYQSAYTAARTAYLDSYEFVEIPLRPIDPDFTLEVEFQFAELRNLINQQADVEKVREITVALKRNIDESERLVSGTGVIAPSIAFSSSFAIIFREGLESVLILGAILTYLEASRNTRFKPYVYYGIVAAIGATAVTWFVASYIVEISGANRELIEAIAALSATAVLFYVSFWILNKIEHKRWMEFIKAKIWQASTTGGVMVFVLLSFFTVYREGFETVLFYQAMFGFAKHMEGFVGLGFVLGIVSLLAVYYGMRRLGKKLPLKALFGLTMGIGAYLSIAFLGNAIRELQILDVVSYTSMLGVIPRLDINLATMTGIYPTLETVVSQIILLAVYLSASFYVLILRPKREQQIAAMRKSRKLNNES